MHLTRGLRRGDDDRGLTLTELLVTIMVLGVIMVPLGNALIGFIRMTDDTSQRLSESRDAQIAAAYFAQDVQSVGTRDWTAYPYPLRQSVERDAPATGGLYPCGAAGTPAAVIRLAWDDPTSARDSPTVIRVSYVVETVGAERQLHRILCKGTAVPTSDIVIAHSLDTTLPAVTCSPACTGAPATVSLTLNIRDPRNTGPAFKVVLSGQRRQT
jgi:prepilin-type N-terminal cleavage/methylation domain-containing protein